MKVLVAAIVLTTALGGAASAQNGGPPGGTILHVGPLSPTGQPAGEPTRASSGFDGCAEGGDLQFSDTRQVEGQGDRGF